MSLRTWLNESPGAKLIEAEEAAKAAKIAQPFDPRTDVSADAKAIIQRLTLLLFWVPLAIGILIGLAYLSTR